MQPSGCARFAVPPAETDLLGDLRPALENEGAAGFRSASLVHRAAAVHGYVFYAQQLDFEPITTPATEWPKGW